MIKKVRILPVLFTLLVFSAATLTAENNVYTLGGKNGWNTFAEVTHISPTTGIEGYDSWQLAERQATVSGYTDVLITFNDRYFHDMAGNYQVILPEPDAFIGVQTSERHGESILFRGNGGITLKGGKNALFGKQGLTGSFTVSFWLKPGAVDSGEQIISWHSSRNLSNYSLYQMIIASFEHNHLTWMFTNVFDQYSDENNTVELQGKSILIPNQWSYHQLVYHSDTGLIEYLVDGRIEDMKFVTDSGRETGTIYPVHLGVVADLDICSSYTGYLDDFSILNAAIDTQNRQGDLFDRFEKSGEFVTGIFEIAREGCKIASVQAVEQVPDFTDTGYYIRWSEQPYGWTDSNPEWHEIAQGESLLPLQDGYKKYYQLKARLYSDGNAQYTPVVTGFSIDYQTRESLTAPYNCTAEAENGAVTLRWKAAPSEGVGSYLVYYGERPGEYLGTCAIEGESPIQLGNVTTATIHGLKNGTVYYFAVCARSEEEPIVTGPLSAEVAARPGSKKRR